MGKSGKLKISIPILITFCIFIHPVKLKGPAILSYMYQYGIPFAYVFLHIRSVLKLSRKQAIIYGLLLLLVMLSIIYPTVHSTNDYSYVKVATYIFRKMMIYIFLVSILVKHYREEARTELFMYYFALVQAVYVVGTMVFVFVPGLKHLWFSIFNEVIESGTLMQSFGYTFRIGWQGFSGYEFTIACSISCMFLLYLYCKKRIGFSITAYQFIVPFCLCALGNMFYGRSGLVVTIFASGVGLLAWNRGHLLKVFKLVGIMFIFILGVYMLRNVGIFKEWYYWMSTPIINLFTTGSFNNISISTTHDMVFYPGLKTLLLGDGYYVKDGHYYMMTDSGFMRSILLWGVVGTFTSYITTMIALWETKKHSVILFALLFCSFLAFEYKGHIYFEFILIMLAMTYVETLKSYYLVR